MTAAEEKIKVIEKVLETDDAFLLREIASLLHTPSLADYGPQPISHDELQARINRAEEAAHRGDVTAHEDVKKLVATWNQR